MWKHAAEWEDLTYKKLEVPPIPKKYGGDIWEDNG